MKKRKWNRVLSVLLVMVTVISLMSGCDRKSAKNEEKDTITVYLWSTNLYEKDAPYIQKQLPDINIEFVEATMIWISIVSLRKMADCQIS